jgi:hypothetical protein
MQLSSGKNTISDARFKAAEDKMFERQYDEWELVHGAYGVEELPSQLERRHNREHNNLSEDRHNSSIAQWLKLYPDVTVDARLDAGKPAAEMTDSRQAAQIAAGLANRSAKRPACKAPASASRHSSNF